jgi:hypothetical protein
VGKKEVLEVLMLITVSMATVCALGVAFYARFLCFIQGMQTPAHFLPGVDAKPAQSSTLFRMTMG